MESKAEKRLKNGRGCKTSGGADKLKEEEEQMKLKLQLKLHRQHSRQKCLALKKENKEHLVFAVETAQQLTQEQAMTNGFADSKEKGFEMCWLCLLRKMEGKKKSVGVCS